MSLPIILDTSAFLSLGNIEDSNYQKAAIISKQIEKGKLNIIVPGEIFTEIVNIVGKKTGHQAAVLQAEKILSSASFTITETDSDIRTRALEKFRNQPESVSYTDCLVMVFAEEYETKDIFGFDDTFRKNGFVRFGIDNPKTPLPK